MQKKQKQLGIMIQDIKPLYWRGLLSVSQIHIDHYLHVGHPHNPTNSVWGRDRFCLRSFDSRVRVTEFLEEVFCPQKLCIKNGLLQKFFYIAFIEKKILPTIGLEILIW